MSEPKKLEIQKAVPNTALPVELAAKSGVIIIVEFRGQTRDVMRWTDQKSGAAIEKEKLNISAEFPETGKQLMLEVFPPRDVLTIPFLPYEKGDLILVELSQYESGLRGVRGRVHQHQLFLRRANP